MIKKYLPFLVLAVVFVCAYQYCFDSKLDLNGDNASYIQLARTLSDGTAIPTPRLRALLRPAIFRPVIRPSSHSS